MKILSLSGFIPEHICDIVHFEGYLGDTSISHYCQYAADYISQVLKDNSVDGAVFPKTCDSTRIIKSYLEETEKFVYQLPVPSRLDDLAVNYFAEEIKAYQKSIETYFGFKITNIEERIERINSRNKEIKQLYDNLENISYGDYLKGIHEMLAKPLFEQSVLKPKEINSRGKRVYLVGSYLTSMGILDVLENLKLNVVGDNFPESGRISAAIPCEIKGDIYKNISQSILSARLSPTQNNFENIIANDIREIKEKDVKGVIFITQKYCEAYDYLYSVYEKRLQAEGIKSLKISLSKSDDFKKFALETFSDMI